MKAVSKLLVKPWCSYVDANKVDAMIKPRYNRADAMIKPRYNRSDAMIKPRFNRSDAMVSDRHISKAVFIDRTTDREDSTVNAMPGARSSATHLKEATTIDLFQEEAIAAITAAIAPLV